MRHMHSNYRQATHLRGCRCLQAVRSCFIPIVDDTQLFLVLSKKDAEKGLTAAAGSGI